MTQSSRRKKRDTDLEPKPRGRQNAFSGEKLEFLESYKDEFLGSNDRGGFYTLVTKAFIQKFGYPEDLGDIEDGEASLSLEEQRAESDKRDKFYHNLREVSTNMISRRQLKLTILCVIQKLGCWFRYRYTARNTNQSYINNIISRITSSSVSCPWKKVAINLYAELNKDQFKTKFDALWDLAKATTKGRDRIKRWNEYLREHWEKEPEDVRKEISKQTEEENDKMLAEWKKKATFSGSAEDFSE